MYNFVVGFHGYKQYTRDVKYRTDQTWLTGHWQEQVYELEQGENTQNHAAR